jgi:hypothetical protein
MVYREEKARRVKLRVLIKMSIKGRLVHSQDSFVRSLYTPSSYRRNPHVNLKFSKITRIEVKANIFWNCPVASPARGGNHVDYSGGRIEGLRSLCLYNTFAAAWRRTNH